MKIYKVLNKIKKQKFSQGVNQFEEWKLKQPNLKNKNPASKTKEG